MASTREAAAANRVIATANQGNAASSRRGLVREIRSIIWALAVVVCMGGAGVAALLVLERLTR